MPWRGMVPVQLVIGLIGIVLLLTTLTMSVLAILGRPIPQELTTVSISSLTAVAGLLAPNTGLTHTGRQARHAAVAGQAAAQAVMEHEGLHDIAMEAYRLQEDEKR